jgi:hypothetical protein
MIFTNGRLKAGKNRVVTLPGEQNTLDSYSMLMTSRPALDTPMRAFGGLAIPQSVKQEAVLTCDEWGDKCMKEYLHMTVKGHIGPKTVVL